MQTWQIVVAVALGAAVLAGLALAATGRTRAQLDAKQLDSGIVAEYCRLVAEERYAEAFEKCLTSSYRKQARPEKFAAALQKRRGELGPMLGRELVQVQSSRNLFSGTRSYQLRYQLRYAAQTLPRVLVVDDSDGEARIDGTFFETAGDSLSFEVW